MLLFALACASDSDVVPADRTLETFTYGSATTVSPGETTTFIVPAFSAGSGRLRVLAVETLDVRSPQGSAGGAFRVPAWIQPGCDNNGDGTDDCHELLPADPDSDADTLPLTLSFTPDAVGDFEAELLIWSDDSRQTERLALPEAGRGDAAVHRVQIRGAGRPACARAWPTFADHGPRPVGGEYRAILHIESCAVVRIVIDAITFDDPSLSSGALTPLYVLPGETAEVPIVWVVAPDAQGAAAPVDAAIHIASNSALLGDTPLRVIGNVCDQSVLPGWDADGDGWTVCAGDCDDSDATVFRGAPERPGTGVDEDCDLRVDEPAITPEDDADGDGWTTEQGDCDDADSTRSPRAVEAPDGVDDDCDGVADDGTEWVDDDGDGLSEREGDCDDANVVTGPAATETINGVDDDCDGIVDEGALAYDDDGDGYVERSGDEATDDCDDGDPWASPVAREYCDGYDNDCDRIVDEGEDGTRGGACVVAEGAFGTEPGCASGGGASSGPVGLLLGVWALCGRLWGDRRARAT